MADGSSLTLDAAAAAITPAEERRIARELSPAVAWPTLALAIALPVSFWGVAYAGFSGAAPIWACTPILSLLAYAHYTLVHESIHDNLIPGKARGLNTLVGWIGALGFGAGWPALQRTHVLHHAHTNTDNDPDIFVKGDLAQLIRKWAMAIPMFWIPLGALKWIAPARYKRLGTVLSGAEIAQMTAVTLAVLVFMGVAIATGNGWAWLWLWFVPTRLAVLLLNVFFQWLPHHPFDRTERYYNTRVSLWIGGGVFTLQQNLHLMHHLWPSVPFYNYGRLYARLRPLLVAKGARIEGFGLGTTP
jgi:fatty acid desaturase